MLARAGLRLHHAGCKEVHASCQTHEHPETGHWRGYGAHRGCPADTGGHPRTVFAAPGASPHDALATSDGPLLSPVTSRPRRPCGRATTAG